MQTFQHLHMKEYWKWAFYLCSQNSGVSFNTELPPGTQTSKSLKFMQKQKYWDMLITGGRIVYCVIKAQSESYAEMLNI